MKTHTLSENMNMAAQGDVLFIRAQKLPESAQHSDKLGDIVVAHSETGHNHVVSENFEAKYFTEPSDPFTCYLQIDSDFADVVHHRSFDTHETIRLPKGLWQVRRQREYTPEGYRMVED